MTTEKLPTEIRKEQAVETALQILSDTDAKKLKMTDIAATPPETLTRARRIALGRGLRYVYTGNVHDTEGGTTHCPHCGKAVIVRDWYQLLDYRVDADGRCKECGGVLAGRYQAFDIKQQFGSKRIPVQLATAEAG